MLIDVLIQYTQMQVFIAIFKRLFSFCISLNYIMFTYKLLNHYVKENFTFYPIGDDANV